VAKKNLNGPQIAGLFVNDGRFSSAKRVGAVILPDQSDRGYLFINQSGILPGANMIGMINAAWKHIVIQRAFTTFKPSQDTSTGGLKELKLDWPAGLLLDNDGSRTNLTTADKIADFDFDYVAAAQLAVDREIEHGTIANTVRATQPEPDRPDLLKFQRTLGTH
jgi:hypothetical protein